MYYYKEWLGEEFSKRCKKNPSYSLRAFSKFLEIDPSSISQILSGKRKISPKLKNRFIEKLAPSPKTIRQFDAPKISKGQKEEAYKKLPLDTFKMISDWYHYAILELTLVKSFKRDNSWIAKQLGITATEVQIAIERLKRLKLIKEVDGKLVKTNQFITNFKDGATSSALKKFQKEILDKALDAIDNTPQKEKDITAMTLAIDTKLLPEAKKKIKEFRRSLSCFLEETGSQTRVYNLAIQLYPISKETN